MSCFFFSSRRRHTRCLSDWSSDVCSSDLPQRRAVRRDPIAAVERDAQKIGFLTKNDSSRCLGITREWIRESLLELGAHAVEASIGSDGAIDDSVGALGARRDRKHGERERRNGSELFHMLGYPCYCYAVPLLGVGMLRPIAAAKPRSSETSCVN